LSSIALAKRGLEAAPISLARAPKGLLEPKEVHKNLEIEVARKAVEWDDVGKNTYVVDRGAYMDMLERLREMSKGGIHAEVA
jgi:hypothetical protein